MRTLQLVFYIIYIGKTPKKENDYDEKDARQATVLFKEHWNEIAFSDFFFFIMIAEMKIERKRHFLKLQKKKKRYCRVRMTQQVAS